jgi:hypothetical protein
VADNMTTIADGTKVIVVAENEELFKGTIVSSGSQAKILMYAVLLDQPELYPNIEPSVKIVVVPETAVRLDTVALFGEDYYVDVTKPSPRI